MNINVLIFDGDCPLCNRLIRILVTYDKSRKLKLASASSNYVQNNNMLNEFDLNQTVVYINSQGCYQKSEAVYWLLHDIYPKKRVLWIFSVLPFGFIDKFYDLIANNRYRILKPDNLSCAFNAEVSSRLLP